MKETIQLDWNLIISVTSALGIFKLVEQIILYSLNNNLVKKNLEIREIAERVLCWNCWLKEKNFEVSLPPEAISLLYIDSMKMQGTDDELSNYIMDLITYPRLIAFFGADLVGEPSNIHTIRKFHGILSGESDKMTSKLNQLRYQPFLDFSKVKFPNIRNLMNHISHRGKMAE